MINAYFERNYLRKIKGRERCSVEQIIFNEFHRNECMDDVCNYGTNIWSRNIMELDLFVCGSERKTKTQPKLKFERKPKL